MRQKGFIKFLRIFTISLLLLNSVSTPLANVAGEDTEAPVAVQETEQVVVVNETSNEQNSDDLETDNVTDNTTDTAQESTPEADEGIAEGTEEDESSDAQESDEDTGSISQGDSVEQDEDAADEETEQEHEVDEDETEDTVEEPTISDLSLRNEKSSIQVDGVVEQNIPSETIENDNGTEDEEASDSEKNTSEIENVLVQREAFLRREQNTEENKDMKAEQLLTTGTPKATCEQPSLSPTPLKKHQVVTITCNGENVGMRQLQVKQGNLLIMTTGKQSGNTFLYSPAFAGTFTFECRGRAAAGATGDPVCSTSATVEDVQETAECYEPTLIGNFALGETVQIKCNGNNLASHQLKISGPTGTTTTPKSTNPIFSYTPNAYGNYTFTCLGRPKAGVSGETSCSTSASLEKEEQEAVCREPILKAKEIKKGETFEITCQGDNLMKHQLKVKTPSGQTVTLPQSTNPKFTYQGNEVGTYTFTCLGRAQQGYVGETSCSTTGKVTENQKAVCRDPKLQKQEITIGETFQVTCEGDNIGSHMLTVYKVGSTNPVYTSSKQSSPSFTYKPTSAGSYTFVCNGRPKPGYTGETECRTTGKVKEVPATCTETVTPTYVNQGGTFTVTCQGANIATYHLSVKQGSQTIFTQDKVDTNDDDLEVFTYQGNQAGTYTFVCEGTPESSGSRCQYDDDEDGGDDEDDDRRDDWFDDGWSWFSGENKRGESSYGGSCTPPTKVLCGSIDRQVKPICVDPVTSIAVTSHTNNQEVNSNQVTLQGTFAGDVDRVEVRAGNGTLVNGVVNKANKTWSAVVTVEDGTNTFSVSGLSDDPLCGSKQTTIKLIYEADICRAPIDIKITSHPQLSDNDQLNNIITTSTTPVTVFGTYTGSLQTLMVVVDYSDGTSTTFNATLNTTQKTWTAAIPVKAGTSNIRIKGISSQHEDCNFLTDFIIKYQPEEPVSCESPIVHPEVSVEVGEDFSITCRGANVGAFKMTVKKGEQVVNTQTKTDTNDDDRETFTWKGTPAGQYTIHCDASTENNPTVFVKYCGAKTRVVTEKPYCVDPITSIAITSHSNEQTVTSNQVTISGTFAGDVDKVEVRVNNGAASNGTVNKNTKTWSATVTLIEGINRISVKGLSDDPLCGSKQTTLKLHYEEEDVCRDPITVRVTNIPQLADNDQLNNIVTTSTSPLTVQGTYSGSVQSIMFVVDHASGGSSTYTASLQPSSKTRTVSLPLQPGRSNVWIKGISYQHEECNYLDDFVVDYTPEQPVSCESPIVTPDVSVEVGEDFTITCRGENVGGFKMTVKQGNRTVNEQTATDTNDDDRETFTRTGSAEGTYTIHCDASTESNPSVYVKYCGAKTRIVNEKEPVCEDPVTAIAITSHTNNQEVSGNQVTISGTFSGDVDTVEVRVNNGGVINGTVNKNTKTRSATITLAEGINNITVKGLSTDPLCGTKQTTLKLQYEEEDICRDPITVRVTNIPQLADNDQTNNTITISGTSLLVQGTYEGSVQSIMLVVDATNGSTTYTASLNAVNKTRSVTIPVQAGTSNVWIKGVSYQHEECDYLDDFVLKYLPEEPLSCVSPIVTPDVSVYIDENFTVTCLGENAGGFKMTVRKGDQVVDVQSRADTNDDDRELFTRTGTAEGQYTIHCEASTESNPTQYIKYCGAKTRIVYEREPECVDPVTSLTLTSHTFGQIVTTGNVVISGTVAGGVSRVEVIAGGSTIQATRNGSTRSATINVTGSGTAFTVRAVPNDEDCDTRVVNGLLNVAEQPKKSDPAIDVVCNYNSEISCNDTMRCTAYIVNTTGAQAPAENLQAYLDVIAGNTIISTGLVVQALQNDSLTCQVTQNDQIACTGRLNIGSQATVSFDVKLASCPCEGSNRFVYEGRVQASNGDVNTTNNYDTRTQNITSDQECGNICENPIVLVVDAPVNNSNTRSSSVEVRGTVNGTGAVVRVNNTVVSVASGGAFSTNVGLGIGDNTITITANNNEPECAQTVTRIVDRDSGGGHGGNGRKSTITCGNDRIERSRGEECDDGNNRSGDGCSRTCQIEEDDIECGNGVVELNEQCDDGNTRNGDGCDSTCDLEDEEIKKKVKKVKIEEILTERKRPDPLPFTPTMPPVLPKTGSQNTDTQHPIFPLLVGVLRNRRKY